MKNPEKLRLSGVFLRLGHELAAHTDRAICPQKRNKIRQIWANSGHAHFGTGAEFFDSSFSACAPRIMTGAHRVLERVAGQASSIQLMREQVSDRRLVLGREPAAPTPRFSLCRVKIPRPWLLAIRTWRCRRREPSRHHRPAWRIHRHLLSRVHVARGVMSTKSTLRSRRRVISMRAERPPGQVGSVCSRLSKSLISFKSGAPIHAGGCAGHSRNTAFSI